MEVGRVGLQVAVLMQIEAERLLQIGMVGLHRLRRRQRRHRWWVRPWLTVERRLQYGQFETLMQELRNEDVASFKRYLRITPDMFDEILQRVTHRIQRMDTRFRHAIPAGLKLAVTLRYMATGDTYVSIAYDFRVASETICHFIPEVSIAIADEYRDEVLSCPLTSEGWLEIAQVFERRWNLPHALGALDGKHIAIRKPANSGSLYYNYKGFFSIVLMALVDGNYKFLWCDVGGLGHQSDAQIFGNSELKSCIEDNSIGFPEPSPLPNDDEPIPYFIVGDDAFPMRTTLMKPYRRANLTHRQKIFNYRLSRGRRIVENAFGILASRWQCMARPMLQTPEVIKIVVSACVCLHNLIRMRYANLDRGLMDIEDEEHNVVLGAWRDGLSVEDIDQAFRGGNVDNVSGKQQREYLSLYFSSEAGSVPWQENMI